MMFGANLIQKTAITRLGISVVVARLRVGGLRDKNQNQNQSSRISQPQRGFTLLEILVVISLLSIVMLALGSALRTMGQTEERIDQRVERADDFRVSIGFLQATLGRISDHKAIRPLTEGASPYLFTAAADHIEWVGIMPARYGAGGRYFFRLGLEQLASAAGAYGLVMRYMPWDETAAKFPDWAQAESLVLAHGVSALSIQYQDDWVESPVWASTWSAVDHLPGRVWLNLETKQGFWPDLVIASRSLLVGKGGFGATVGGAAP